MDNTCHLDSLEKLKRFQSQVQSGIEFHRVKKDTVRAIAKYFKLFIIAASALTTISLGLNFAEGSPYVDLSRSVALVFSALATAAATLAAAWDVDNYWLRRNVLLTKLERISDKLHYYVETERELTQVELDSLFDEFQSANDLHINYWNEASKGSVNKDPAQSIPNVN